ncbi:hypothetical protein OG948_36155 (plasmid) [Embleya sp. NBC_00888]|nr:hypothetical protein OG948_36155 [Embleya sp. NBC_00888]
MFGGVVDWIDPIGVTVLCSTAPAAWIIGDPRDRRAGFFDANTGAETNS